LEAQEKDEKEEVDVKLQDEKEEVEFKLLQRLYIALWEIQKVLQTSSLSKMVGKVVPQELRLLPDKDNLQRQIPLVHEIEEVLQISLASKLGEEEMP